MSLSVEKLRSDNLFVYFVSIHSSFPIYSVLWYICIVFESLMDFVFQGMILIL